MKEVSDIRQLHEEWVRLNLGSNRAVMTKWVNVDAYPHKDVDTIADLEDRWTWDDNSVHYIRAFDIFEHLRSPFHTMNEAWRVLGNGGIVEVWVPSTDGRGAFQDPTHVSFWNQNSFYYYSQKHFAVSYPGEITCDFEIRLFDTPKNPSGIVWTWALCRALKPDSEELLSRSWFDALSLPHQRDRIVEGYKGSNFGTTHIDGDGDVIYIG